ncbi:hypothetical protein JW835_15730 [bacterium]|nr:hypothetical protein [bacterium]
MFNDCVKNSHPVLLLIALLPVLLLSGSSYEKIDRHALDTPPGVENSIESLAEYLTRPCQNDREKIRAIFRWITANITYDTQAYFVGAPQRQSENILEDRTAVCDGFSTLIERLGKTAGLNIEKISGYAKGVRYQIGDRFSDNFNHAWNAVRIGGHWELIDATWGAGYIDESGQFIREFDDYFFLTDPEDLIYTHFPEEIRWQLLARPVSLQEFESMPFLKPAYFYHGLKMKSHTQGVIQTEDRLVVTLKNPYKAQLTARLMNNNQYQDRRHILIQYQPYETQIQILFPEKGIYTLRIFVQKQNETGDYLWAMDYLVNAKTEKSNPYGFPEIYRSFNHHNVRLVSPVIGQLKKNTAARFDFIIPGAVETFIIQGDTWTPMNRDQNRFTKTYTTLSGDLEIGARFSEIPKLDILLKYLVK